MSGHQTRQRPAGTGREVEQKIELMRRLYGTEAPDSTSARAGYRGYQPPHLRLVPRDEGTIVRELVAAAQSLRGIAFGAQLAGATAAAVDECRRITAGCDRLLAELRQVVQS